MSGVRSISPFDRILYLKTLPSVGELSSAQIARLANEADEVHFETGQSLISAGEVNHSFFVLTEGAIDIRRGDSPEQRITSPETLGFVEMLAEASTTNAVAVTDVVALRFELNQVLEIFEEDFELLQNTIRTLARGQLALLKRVIGGSRRAPWKQAVPVPTDRDMNLLERLIMIRQGDLFEAVGLEAGVLLATSMRQFRWNAGEELWKPGDSSGETFQAGLGYPLGNIESLAHAPRWYRPVATTDVVGLRADHESFFDVMEDDFEVAEAFLKAMSMGILGAQDRLVELGETPILTGLALTAD
jgi:CRP-like cAMP-binding protein